MVIYLRRHASEALSPGKVIDRDRVERNVALLFGRGGAGSGGVVVETAGPLVDRLILTVVQTIGR